MYDETQDQGTMAVEKPAVIASLMGELHMTMCDVEDAVRSLEDKLDPILSPVGKEVGGESQKSPEIAVSKLAEDLKNKIAVARRVRNVLQEIRSRVEI